ncbi:MAG: M3 family metallopeptidase, partial [Planctomycetota bacterium]
HAFHTFEARSLDLCPNRGSPIEFAEVASTSMELLGAPHLDVFYDDPDAVRRARIKHLDGVLDIFPWVACIDGFQHWVYTHPGHSREQRREAWLEIRERFSLGIDMSGLDEIHGHRWIRQSHLFGVPFYYIEYAIAQLGALQVWRNYRKDPAAAIGAYRRALALGNRRPLKELFEAAEIRFDFSEEILGELLGLVHDEIEALERA